MMGFVDLVVQLSVRIGLVGVEIFRIEVSLLLDQEYEMNEWMDGWVLGILILIFPGTSRHCKDVCLMVLWSERWSRMRSWES